MHRNFFLIVVALFLFSCMDTQDRLERALTLAGENRTELEKVLQYYKDDSLKYKAACFLIENMPYHYGYEDARLDSVKAVLGTAPLGDGYIPDSERKRKWKSFNYKSLPMLQDVQRMTAALLIENIDVAFETWNRVPWAKYYSLDDFCEWILPYRVGDEPLESWRKAYYDHYHPILDSLYQGENILEAADALNKYLKYETPFSPNSDFDLPHLGAKYLLKYRLGTCKETTDHTVYIFRSLGFPVGIDEYLYSPSNQNSHVWNILKNTDGKPLSFWYMDSRDLAVGMTDGRKKGKVYRMQYGVQEEKYQGVYKDNNTPPVVRNPLLKDVTEEYFGSNEYPVGIDGKVKGRFVALGIFTPFGYVPVDVALRDGDQAIVRNIEPEVIYQPLCNEKGLFQPCGYPFMIKDDTVRTFVPDMDKNVSLSIKRKYPLQNHILEYMSWMTGSKIEGSNDVNFRNKEILYCITDTPRVNVNFYPSHPSRPYRYVRFVPRDGWRAEVAELAFYENLHDDVAISSKAILSCPPVDGNPAHAMDKANDGDWLTFFFSEEANGTVTFDLQNPTWIRKILFVPRNDDNFITPGNSYELFYQDGVMGWKSLGKQTATTYELIYTNIPDGALLWLRNLTRGKEEQVFYIEEGKQRFVGYE
jgi:hypothetical protein